MHLPSLFSFLCQKRMCPFVLFLFFVLFFLFMTYLYSERLSTQTNRLISHLSRRRATVEGQVHSEIPLPRVCLSRRRDDAAKHSLSHREQGSQLGFFFVVFCFCFSFIPAVSVSAERRDRVTNTWTFGAICRVFRNWILEPLQAALCPHSAFLCQRLQRL